MTGPSLRASPLRCPYCHDAIELAGAWKACALCLARHHEDCWQTRCAACGGTRALVPEGTMKGVGAAPTVSVAGRWRVSLGPDDDDDIETLVLDLYQLGSEFSGDVEFGGQVRDGTVADGAIRFVIAQSATVELEGRFDHDTHISGSWRRIAAGAETGRGTFSMLRLRS